MNIGALLIVLALAMIIVSLIGFYLAARGKARWFGLARTSYAYFTVLVILASILLMYLFITGDYQNKYVYDYSSSDLPLFYVISAFWAGQQGTYLLWLLMFSLMGHYILRRGREYTAEAMFFYSLITLFFGVILVALSPFACFAQRPDEGAGLNPLLQDPWMVIHPPVIFLGYAAVAIPCALALAALQRGRYDGWVDAAFAPAAFGAVALALGNILGGFWAYKTLGWGGYWAWDPVENSSFIPWMTSLALIHGLVVEKTGASLRRTNIFMAIFTFLLVIYGTFLTRSGVLSDFSVHSFVDLGVNQYIIGFMIGFSVIALGLFAVRSRSAVGAAMNLSATGKDFALLSSVILLTLIALMVLVGTSWPLITTVFGKPGAVDTAIYSRVTLPLAVVIGLFLGFSPFMLRDGGNWPSLVRQVIPSAIGAAVITILAVILGVRPIIDILLILTASLAFLSNLIALARYWPNRFGLAGPQIAHFGFALMLIGILGSSAYSQSKKLTIDREGSASAFDVNVTYNGTEGEMTKPNNKVLLTVADGGSSYAAAPSLYWSEKMQGLMKKPFIKRHLMYDLYFAPEQIEEPREPGLKMRRGESASLGGYTISFVKFDQGSHAAGGTMNFGAVLEVSDSSGRTETIIPSQNFESRQAITYNDVLLMAGMDAFPVRLEKIFADEAAVLLNIPGLTGGGEARLVIEVSKKPTMNILWGGTLLMAAGGILSVRNRWKLSA